MNDNDLSEYLVAAEPHKRERAENWRVAIGLQKVDGAAFFRNNLFGESNELKNRYFHIRAKELGLVEPIGATKPDATINVTTNDTIKPTDIERMIAAILRKTPTTTRAELSVESGLSSRQIQRILDSLKTKSGLRRIGSRKTGLWEFPPHPAT